jgi:transcriptional regulator with XRE-family HTH domain
MKKPLLLPPIREAVALRIRSAREYAGLSQADLAHAVGYTAANPISKMERGEKSSLDIARLAAVARACQVDLDWLIEPALKAAKKR